MNTIIIGPGSYIHAPLSPLLSFGTHCIFYMNYVCQYTKERKILFTPGIYCMQIYFGHTKVICDAIKGLRSYADV